MAIAFDAVSSGQNINNTSTVSLSHTCGTGANRILFVGLDYGTPDTISGVTYAGSAMTQIGTALTVGGSAISLWYIVAPATGANNITVSQSGAQFISIQGVSYTGASQSGVPDSSNTGTITSNAITVPTTTVKDNCWLLMFVLGSNAVTDGTNFTTRIADNFFGFGDSNAAITPAGSTSSTANFQFSAASGGILVSFAPFVASASTSTNQFLLMGIG